MLYTRKSFSCPASSGTSTSQRKWDYATLSMKDFIARYGDYSPVAPAEPNDK
jgi:hypothetical protein